MNENRDCVNRGTRVAQPDFANPSWVQDISISGRPAGWQASEWLHLEEFLVTKAAGVVDSKIRGVIDQHSVRIGEINDVEVWVVGIWG